MKNLQNLHLSMICGDIMVNVLVNVVVFVIIFFAALTTGIILVSLYISAVAKLFDWLFKLFDWLDKKLGK